MVKRPLDRHDRRLRQPARRRPPARETLWQRLRRWWRVLRRGF
ncbi:hypothetical protein ACU5AX_08130 [Sphingomonas sp. XXL09]|nr:hypothetical protein [Sphingomonas sp. MA1305]